MTPINKAELLSQSWQDIKTAGDCLGRAVDRLENAERTIEAVLYLEGCDLDVDPPVCPAANDGGAQKGG